MSLFANGSCQKDFYSFGNSKCQFTVENVISYSKTSKVGWFEHARVTHLTNRATLHEAESIFAFCTVELQLKFHSFYEAWFMKCQFCTL